MRRKPEFITFTGVDDHTPPGELTVISRRYPVEWGVLMSPSQQGKARRFPHWGTMRDLLAYDGLKLSAHLCGEHTRKIMKGDAIDPPTDLTLYSRIQVNHVAPIPHAIESLGAAFGKRCVAQFTHGPFPRNARVDWLYDPSGGIGHKPKDWPRHPGGDRLVGYAGGIGPENVIDVLEEINADGPYWIDMETKVRTEEQFDLGKCRQVLELVYGAR